MSEQVSEKIAAFMRDREDWELIEFGAAGRIPETEVHRKAAPIIERMSPEDQEMVGYDMLHAALFELSKRLEQRNEFKNYVHQRLDEAGIEKEPNGPHTANGCRIGDRLDIVLNPWRDPVVDPPLMESTDNYVWVTDSRDNVLQMRTAWVLQNPAVFKAWAYTFNLPPAPFTGTWDRKEADNG